jgi:hypothetical protein
MAVIVRGKLCMVLYIDGPPLVPADYRGRPAKRLPSWRSLHAGPIA